MKKGLSILILSVIILSLCCTGCPVSINRGTDVTTDSKSGASSVYTIKVTGTDGLPFKGNYWVDESAQDQMSAWPGRDWPISGTTPAEYTISGGFVSCYFEISTKIIAESGTLKVQILEGDKVVTESETTLPNFAWVAAGTSDNKDDYSSKAQFGELAVSTIKVIGTDGIPFKGNYGNVGRIISGEDPIQYVNKDVSGITPAEYSYTLLGGANCQFCKNTESESGTLKVQILVGDEVISEADTTVPHGWVVLAGY